VFVLRAGVTVGRAYGGSEPLGQIVLFAIYLLFVQMVVLLGYLLVLSIDDHLTSASHGGDHAGQPSSPTP
jgi:hypothetical protein